MFAASKTDSVSNGGYQISRSLRFNSADSTNVQRTFSTTGTSQTTSTLSMWFKRGDISRNQRIFDCYDGSSGSSTGIFLDNDVITLDYGRGSGAKIITTQVLRDVSAWYHLVAVMDSTNATSTNRLKLYLNGSQITTFSTAIYPSQNALNNWMSANSNNRIGSSWDGSANFSGYITEVNLIDGQALTPSSFGETNAQTGVWQPKAYSGSYGTNGFYLNFSDNSNTTAATLGKDYSGNGNNWTPNNFSVAAGAGNDSLVDSPTAYGTDTGVGGTVRGNYCTLNPLDKSTSGGSTSNGNLDYAATQSSWDMIRSTFGMSTGKWYWEVSVNSSSFGITGIAQSSVVLQSNYFSSGLCLGYNSANGDKYSGTGGSTTYGASWNASGDICGVAFDADAGTLTFYKNGTSQGVAYTGLSGTYFPAHTLYLSGSTATFNFGQRPFAYTAPSGYKALCTQNLPTPTIGATTATQAGKYYNAAIYAGTSATHQIPNGINMASNGGLVWTKSRSQAGADPVMYDSIRGAGYFLKTDSTASEIYSAISLVSFDADGVTFGADTAQGYSNYAPYGNYVAWAWAAGGSGVTNTAGSITSTVSANTTSGFSVVTFTGTGANATVGHGLGVAPSMIITKVRNQADNWYVYHVSAGTDKLLYLNLTNATVTNTSIWQNTAPTSSVFYIGGAGFPNTWTEVAYCFAEVAGYSKFGSYTGNQNNNGPFVYCGFKPAYVMIKSSTGATNWVVLDDKRDTYNVEKNKLYPNTSDAEDTSGENSIDFVANGFKIRSDTNKINDPGATYIFAAFASAPLKFSLAR